MNAQINMNARARTPSQCEADLEEYNRQIIAQRSAEVVGKTVQGTFSFDGKRYWIKWNSKKHDKVYIKTSLVHSILGEGIELKQKLAANTQLRCTINGLGPDMKIMRCKTAWFMHPQTNSFEIVTPEPTARFFGNIRRAKSSPRCSTGSDRSKFFGRRTQGEAVCWRRN